MMRGASVRLCTPACMACGCRWTRPYARQLQGWQSGPTSLRLISTLRHTLPLLLLGSQAWAKQLMACLLRLQREGVRLPAATHVASLRRLSCMGSRAWTRSGARPWAALSSALGLHCRQGPGQGTMWVT